MEKLDVKKQATFNPLTWLTDYKVPNYTNVPDTVPGINIVNDSGIPTLVPTKAVTPDQLNYLKDPKAVINQKMLESIPSFAMGALGVSGAAILAAKLMNSIQQERARTKILRNATIKLPSIKTEKSAAEGFWGMADDVRHWVGDIFTRDFGARNPNMLYQGLLLNPDGWKYYLPALAAVGLSVPAVNMISNHIDKSHWNNQLNKAREEYVALMREEDERTKKSSAELTDLDWFEIFLDDAFEKSGAEGQPTEGLNIRQFLQGVPGLYWNVLLLSGLLGGGLGFAGGYDKEKKDRRLFQAEMQRTHTNPNSMVRVEPLTPDEEESFSPITINKIAALVKLADNGQTWGEWGKDLIPNAMNAVGIGGAANSVVDTAKGTLDSALDHSIQRVQDKMGPMISQFSDSLGSALEKRLPDAVSSLASNEKVQTSLGDMATSFGGKLVDSVSSGIKNKVSDLGQMAWNGLKDFGGFLGGMGNDAYSALMGSYQNQI